MGALDRRIGSGCRECRHESRDEIPFLKRTQPSGTVVPIGGWGRYIPVATSASPSGERRLGGAGTAAA
jgi:hypothetical protein